MTSVERLRGDHIERVREMVSDPLWYKEFTKAKQIRMQSRVAFLGIAASVTSKRSLKSHLIHEYYDIFEQLLTEDAVALGDIRTDSTLYDWDSERDPAAPNKIIIHHTSRNPGITPGQLSATELLRLYVPHYQNPPESDRPRIEGKPIHSGHYDQKGKQNFWPYHWLIREDGSPERLLADHETGWQAGNWAVNCESVAICIDDDLTTSRPAKEVLEGVSHVIDSHYRAINLSPDTLLGHNEVNFKTTCPGKEFISGWKVELLNSLAD